MEALSEDPGVMDLWHACPLPAGRLVDDNEMILDHPKTYTQTVVKK